MFSIPFTSFIHIESSFPVCCEETKRLVNNGVGAQGYFKRITFYFSEWEGVCITPKPKRRGNVNRRFLVDTNLVSYLDWGTGLNKLN